MSSAWSIRVGLESEGRCPYERKAEGDWRHVEMPERDCCRRTHSSTGFLLHLSKAFEISKSGLCSPYEASVLHGKAHGLALNMVVVLSEPITSTIP